MPRQHLTSNACLVCRKKRTKCDGQIPCRRCRSRGEECAYEDKKWRTKDHLRSEIERLRTEQRQGHAVIRALTNNDPVKWEAVLDRMRGDESPDSIAQWIQSTSDLPGTSSQRPTSNADGPGRGFGASPPPLPSPFRPSTSRHSFSTPSELRGRRGSSLCSSSAFGAPRGSLSAITPSTSHLAFGETNTFATPHPLPSVPDLPTPSSMGTCALGRRPSMQSVVPESSIASVLRLWTAVTTDVHLVHRLLNKLFSNEPFFSLPLISQPQFLRDFCGGNTQFCSESLVNAILGWGCRRFDAPSQLVSQVSFGDAFLGDARRLLSMEQAHVSLPSIQALGVLALAEVSQGNDDEAWTLIQESVRSSINLMLQSQHQNPQSDEFGAVRALVYCGGFTLMRLLCLLTGRFEPNTGPLFMRLQSNMGDSGEDAPEARIERGISLQMRFFSELQFCTPLARFVFEVTEAVHTFASYNFSNAMTAEDLEDAYSKCLASYSRFGEVYGSQMGSTQDLLFAEIWYHFCLLSLLRPFINNTASLVSGRAPRLRDDVVPRTVCQHSSEAVIFLTSTYQTRYSLKYPSPFHPHMVFAAVLYQLTLAVERPNPHALDRSSAIEMPVKMMSPCPPFQPTPSHDPGTVRPVPFRTPSFSSRGIPQPLSPTLSMQAQRAARRRASALSMVSMCSTGLVPSTSDLTPSVTSDRDEVSSSEESSDYLPAFTSEPAELVTIGSLQLMSMGAQHAGAANAAHLLRSLGDLRELVGSGVDLTLLAKTLPFPASDFNMSMLLTGLGSPGDAVPPVATAGFHGGTIPLVPGHGEAPSPFSLHGHVEQEAAVGN